MSWMDDFPLRELYKRQRELIIQCTELDISSKEKDLHPLQRVVLSEELRKTIGILDRVRNLVLARERYVMDHVTTQGK